MNPEPKAKPASALPLQTVAEEIAFLGKSFREVLEAYAGRIDSEIARLHALVNADVGSKKKLPAGRVHDLRDMLMLLRSLELKPAKGRRRDLKKIESAVEELSEVAERWA